MNKTIFKYLSVLEYFQGFLDETKNLLCYKYMRASPVGPVGPSASPPASSVRARLARARTLDDAVTKLDTAFASASAGGEQSAGCDKKGDSSPSSSSSSSAEAPASPSASLSSRARATLATCRDAQAACESSMESSRKCLEDNKHVLSASEELERKWEEFQQSFQNMMNAMVERIGESIRADPKGAAAALGLSASELGGSTGASSLTTCYEHTEIDFDGVLSRVRQSNNIVFLTGAGVSVSSGIPTYRGADGTWTLGSENYTPQEIATNAMYTRRTSECWSYFTDRWKMCKDARPNDSHAALAELEQWWGSSHRDAAAKSFTLISQNIDNLHRRAGSSNLLEIHGNMNFVRCLNTDCPCNCRTLRTMAEHGDSTNVPTCSECGEALRPHVLFFDESYSEALYQASSALAAIADADVLVVVGTMCSTNLPNRIVATAGRRGIPIIDINPNKNDELMSAPLLQYVAKSDDALPRLVAALRAGCRAEETETKNKSYNKQEKQHVKNKETKKTTKKTGKKKKTRPER